MGRSPTWGLRQTGFAGWRPWHWADNFTSDQADVPFAALTGPPAIGCTRIGKGCNSHRTYKDFLGIGGGVIGLQIAFQWKRRHPDQSVMVLEKEKICGEHSSGRNSGVLHAGFYYSADSLKARSSRDGNKALTAYCEEHELPIRHTGKLVVTRDESEHAALDELLRRAEVNGVELEAIDEAQAKEIEPRAKTAGRAAWSPTTTTVDPSRVMARIAEEAGDLGIVVRTDAIYQATSSRPVESLWPRATS